MTVPRTYPKLKRPAERLALCAGVTACCLALGACGGDDAAGWDWGLPPDIPNPALPEDNPMSTEKVELGRYLFYDERLSGNETQSCASCHQQTLAFTDGLAQSIGSTGEETPRGSMTLANVAYVPVLTWANPLLHDLSEQALVPMFGEVPVELGLAGLEDELIRRLQADETYQDLFTQAFPQDSEPFTLANLTDAIACFQRTLMSFDSPYDRYMRGDDTALSDSAIRGLNLFFSEEVECFHCHGGFTLTDSFDTEHNAFSEFAFHNNGLYNIDGRGGYPEPNVGLYFFTEDPSDMGKFRAPSLRNIAVTGPYMHDGTIETLSEVLDHYAAGGRNIVEGPNFGDGRENPNKSIFVRGFPLDEERRADLLAFLDSLTDETFLTNPAFASPF